LKTPLLIMAGLQTATTDPFQWIPHNRFRP